MGPSACPPATRSPSSRMRARGRATSSLSPRSSGPACSTGSACGSRPNRCSGGSRRSREPGDARRVGTSGDPLSPAHSARRVCDDDAVRVAHRSVARRSRRYRTRRGALGSPTTSGRSAPSRASAALTRSLWSLSLGELGLFRRYLALSSRLVELEAAHAELEAARLDLWLRRLTLDLTAEPGAEPLEQAAPPPFTCARYPVGRVEFVSCREPVGP